jgi:AP-1 complex subunit mu
MLSALFFTDLSGKILISRNYRGDVPVTCIQKFATKLQEEDDSLLKPVYTEEGITYVYIKLSNIYILSVTKRNANVTMMMVYMYHVASVLENYFGELSEESIRDNFVIIYELLDEMMDFGMPQTTEVKILREFITQSGNRVVQPRPPVSLTNAVSWRSEGIKHRKNEIFLDVVEKLNLLVSSSGSVLHSEIIGAVKMRSFLSGMPELKLGLNDKLLFKASGRSGAKGKAVEMEDIKFHQVCVCMYVCMYVCMHVCMYVWMDVCMHVCMCIYSVYVCMHACIYVCMSIW